VYSKKWCHLLIRKTIVNDAVITAAGRGTRLLPTTKVIPKEMLPIFSRGSNGGICMKPVLQVIFEQLFDFGMKRFRIVLNSKKKGIIQHFTFDGDILRILQDGRREDQVGELLQFYDKLCSSSLDYVYQEEALGFGDAVLRAEPYVREPFLVQAGDTHIITYRNRHLEKLFTVFEKYSSAATFLVREVKQTKQFGIAEGYEVERNVYRVTQVVEKPASSKSNLAITALYVFTPAIFKALRSITSATHGEFQLTDGIQRLIDSGLPVSAVKLDEDALWLDVSNFETYLKALTLSYGYFNKEETYKSIILEA
jgi:UTP--glucose-1-phosphate uridylyltransferase